MLQFTPREIVIISAMAENRTIGSGEGMPWNVPEEYQHFVDTVRQQAVVIGRRSYDIFGADYDADNFVISRSKAIEGVTVCSSIEDALQQAGRLDKTIFIGGGRSIYELGLPHATRMVLSTIKGTFDGDVSFPEFDESEWRVAAEQDRSSFVLRDWRRTTGTNI